MKLHVVHDEVGVIVAAAVIDDGGDAYTAVPLPGPRQAAAEVEVPEEHRDKDLGLICTQLRVDGERLRPAPAEEQSSRAE
ncbi:MAG: hypothetical protein ACOYD4_02510 [Solirubrobacterales bacterium]